MRKCHFLSFLLAPALALIIVGCQSLRLQKKAEFKKEFHFALSASDKALAESLAWFSMGILHEGMHDGLALTNYMRAVELEPAQEELYVRIAAEHIKHGEKEHAIAVIEQACEKNPQSFDTHLYLSQIYEELKNYNKAKEVCLKAIAIAPGKYQGYAQLASIFLAQKDEDSAFNTLENALDKVSDKLPLLRMLGDRYAQKINIAVIDKSRDQLQKAISYYEQAAQAPHDDFWLTYLERLGDLYILSHDIDKAIKCFKRHAVHEPDNIQVQKKLVMSYLAIDDKENAIQILQTLEHGNPENAELHYYLGQLYEAIGDMPNAITSFTSACNTPPPNPMPYLKLALLYLMTDVDRAILTLQDGLVQLPENVRLLELLANMYLKNGQFEEAIKLFDKIENIAAKQKNVSLTPEFFINFAIAYEQSKLPEKAALLYKKAIELAPLSLEAYIRLASLYMSLNQEDSAIEIMEQGTEKMPDVAEAFLYLGLFNNAGQRFEKAIEAFSRVEELSANSPQLLQNFTFLYNYGAACERIGQTEKAEVLLYKSIQLQPENANAFNYLAYMWAEKGTNLNLAFDYVTHALDLEPENGAFLDTLGWIYYQKKNYKEALEYIQNGLYFIRDDPTIAEHLGDILFSLQRKQEAINWWIYSFQLKPDNNTLEDKLIKQGIDTKKWISEIKAKKEPALQK